MSLQNSRQISDVKVMIKQGANGKGIESIEKTGTSGLIDTYTITYTDGTKTTYDVENGNGIDHISKTASTSNVDTYTIYFTNGQTTTYDVYYGTTADVIGYDNTSSGLSASNVQNAIDEIDERISKNTISAVTSEALTYDTDYEALSDGYIRIYLPSNNSNYYCQIKVDGEVLLKIVATASQSVIDSLYVRKGAILRYDASSSSAGAQARFYPLA